MHTKIIIAATVAALSLATTAFAAEGEGRGQAFPTDSFADSTPLSNTGSSQYQGYSTNQTIVRFDNTVLRENGQNRPVESANSLPRGFADGTDSARYAQSVDRYFAQQADHRFAQQQAGVNGRRG